MCICVYERTYEAPMYRGFVKPPLKRGFVMHSLSLEKNDVYICMYAHVYEASRVFQIALCTGAV